MLYREKVLPNVRKEDGAVKGLYKVLEDIVWLTQLGLNMLLPLVLCLTGCWWAVNRWNWPVWLYLPAIFLGLAAGAPGPCPKGQNSPCGLQRTSITFWEVCV